MKKNKTDFYLTFIIPVINPFLGLIYSIKNYRLAVAKYLFIIFCAFYGSVLIYHKDGTTLGAGADLERYALMFMDAYSKFDISISEFFDKLDSHDRLDFYNPLVVYFLSRVTGNPHVYFMIIGLIFGFFYANNVWDVITFTRKRFNWLNGMFLIVFALICSFDTIGTVRMHTGFHVFFYGIFSFLVSGKKSRLIWVPLAVLFHFSLFYLVAFTVVFFLVKKMDSRILLIFFLIAHLINELDLKSIHNIFSFMPTEIEARLSIYSSEEKVEMLEQTGKFYLGESNLWARIDSMLIRTVVLVLTILLFIPKNYHLTKISKMKPLLNFSLILYGFSLVIANLPSGYRFMTIASMFFFAYYVILFTKYAVYINSKFNLILKIIFPLLMVIAFKLIRNILDFTSIFMLIGNFFSSFLVEFNVTILDTFRQLL